MLSSRMLKQFSTAYEDDALETAVYGASPVGLVVLLYEGAIKAINQACVALEAKRFDEKANLTSKAIDIIDGLRSVLDAEKGGAIAENLNDLYLYMRGRLLTANSKNDLDIFSEVSELLKSLLPAWQQIDRPAKAE